MKKTASPAAFAGLVALMAACSSTPTPTTSSDGGSDSSTTPPVDGGAPRVEVDCGRPACPQDLPVTASSKKRCEDAFSSSCGGLFGIQAECIRRKIRCDVNGLDPASASAAVSACKAEIDDFEKCSSPDAVDGG